MRSITCPHCSRTVSAADEAWDRAAASGVCPRCGKLLDSSKEAEAVAAAAVDPGIRRKASRARLGALAIGIGCLAATVVLVVTLGQLFYWLPVAGVANLGFALLYSPEAEARNRARRPTDLSGL